MNYKNLLLVLFILGIFIVFFRLGDVGLFEPDEGRYADIAREMVETGDYLVPRMNHIEHFHKPPAAYWAIALSYRLFGYTETAVRFPSACAAVGLALITFLLARKLYETETALLSTLVLLASPRFFFISRLATADMLFSCFVAASIYGLISAEFSNSRSSAWSLLGFFFLSLAVLTKGPIGILIALFAIVGGAAFSKSWRKLLKINWILGIPFFLLLSLPWFLYVCARYTGLSDFFLFRQTVDRIFSSTEHVEGIFYPLFVFLVGFCPWSVLTPWAVKKAVFSAAESENPSSGFLFAWFMLPFVFFSLIITKQPAYILPLFPALCMIMGRAMKPFVFDDKGIATFGKASLWVLVFIFFGGSVAFFVYALYFIRPALIEAKPYFIVLSFLTLIVSFLLLFATLKRKMKFIFTILVFSVFAFFLLFLFMFPRVSDYRSRAGLIKHMLPYVGEGDKIIAYRAKTTALPFYTGRRIIEMGHRNRDIEDASRFTDGSEAEYYFPQIGSIYPFLEGKSRVFVLTKKENFPKIKRECKKPLCVLAEGRKWMVFSNRKV